MENQFDTDEQLRNALRDFEATPDGGSFDAILEKMKQKKKRRLFIIFFWTGLIALSGIAVPLVLGFYGSAKPSAISTAKTKATAPALNKTATDITQATLTATDAHAQHVFPSSTGQASSSERTKPENKTDPAGSRYMNHRELALTSASSEKKHPEKKSATPAGNPGSVATDHNAEPNHKTDFTSDSPEEAGTAHGAPAKSSQHNALNDHSRYTATAPEIMYMSVIHIALPADSNVPDVVASLKAGTYPAQFLVPNKKTTLSFYLGAQASPQFNGFAVSKNPNRDQGYNASFTNFPEFYLEAKKDQSHFNFSLPFGMKAGLQINTRYEVFAGIGYQSFTEKEKLYAVSPSTVTSIIDPSISYSTAVNFSVPYKNQFRYLYYSLEANRLFHAGKAIGFKAGLSLYGNQLLNSNYVFAVSPNTYGQTVRGRENLSPWLLTTKVKAGVIFNPNKRFQLHVSPGFFYTPTSVFKKEYVIRQKPYGVDVECLLLFRLFKI